MIPTKITFYHLLWFACIISGALLWGSSGWKYFGITGCLLGGIIGMAVGFIIGGLPESWATKRFFKNMVGMHCAWFFHRKLKKYAIMIPKNL